MFLIKNIYWAFNLHERSLRKKTLRKYDFLPGPPQRWILKLKCGLSSKADESCSSNVVLPSYIVVADIDECSTPGICKGVCHNTIGKYYCTDCPYKTQYDTIQMQCTSTKRQNLLLGELYTHVNFTMNMNKTNRDVLRRSILQVSLLGFVLVLAFYLLS